MKENTKLLTIGQFADLHGINKKTLMWYDQIGLFAPAAVNPENGYRYYNYHQSSILETILLLRELDVSIKEIQDFMNNRSAFSLKCLLDQKIAELDCHIANLKAIRETMRGQRQNMETLLTMDLSKISMVEKEERYLVTLEINDDTSFDKQVEMITAETKRHHLRRLHDAAYGTMTSTEDLYHYNFNHYCKLFIEIPLPIEQCPGLFLRPKGTYLRAFHKGAWEGISLKYQEILSYAKDQKLTLSGFSYEMGINENVIDSMEDYITQIEIPILKANETQHHEKC